MKAKDIRFIDKKDYVKTVKRDYPPLYASIWIDGSTDEKNYKGILKKEYSRKNNICLDYVWYYYLPSEELGKKIIIKEWNSKKEFERVKRIFLRREKKLLDSTEKDIKIFIRELFNYMPAMPLVYFAESFYDLAKNILIKKAGEKRAGAILDLIRLPLDDNFFKKEEKDLLKAKDLKKHVKKYEWLYSRYGSEETYGLKDAIRKIKSINKIEFNREYKENKRKIRLSVKEAKRIIGAKKSYLIDIIQFIVYYRTQRVDVFNQAAYFAIPKLKAEAKRIGLAYKELLFCTRHEILTGDIPPRKEIRKRISGHAMVEIDKIARCYIGEEYDSLKEIFKESVDETEKFKGFIASKGFAAGNAKIILTREDFGKVKKGDILVASMTTPEMLPLMNKAAAFVTDEGGITCHAAIVSREMKKPCIIGTKIATQVLHDGDLVEVDAEKGEVKIIKK